MSRFTIETDRLILRPFELSDADSYFAMTRDSNIREYVPYACASSIEETREDILKYYSKGDLKHDYYLVIEGKETHQMVGALIATQNQNAELEVCIMIVKEQRRKGYITEATKAFIEALPSKTCLMWKIRSDNVASLQSVSKIQGVREVTDTKRIKEGETYFRIFKSIVQ